MVEGLLWVCLEAHVGGSCNGLRWVDMVAGQN